MQMCPYDMCPPSVLLPLPIYSCSWIFALQNTQILNWTVIHWCTVQDSDRLWALASLTYTVSASGKYVYELIITEYFDL